MDRSNGQALAVKLQDDYGDGVALKEAQMMVNGKHPYVVECSGYVRWVSPRGKKKVLIFFEGCRCSLDKKQGQLTMAHFTLGNNDTAIVGCQKIHFSVKT